MRRGAGAFLSTATFNTLRRTRAALLSASPLARVRSRGGRRARTGQCGAVPSPQEISLHAVTRTHTHTAPNPYINTATEISTPPLIRSPVVVAYRRNSPLSLSMRCRSIPVRSSSLSYTTVPFGRRSRLMSRRPEMIRTHFFASPTRSD